MAINRVYATKRAIEHMWRKHKVEWDEVEDALSENPPLYRTYASETGERRYVAFGTTSGSRRLIIVMAKESNNVMRVITAREPQRRKQKRRARRKQR